MSKTKYLTLQGITFSRVLLGLLSLIMIAVSGYLTSHYYEAHFPTRLVSGSMCDISSFWNCDTAVFSKFSSILSVPTSIFGIIVGFIFLINAIFGNKKLEQANYLVSLLNAIGCLSLLMYSLLALNGLCPGCTIYYICSFAVLGLYCSKGSFEIKLPLLPIASYLIFSLTISASFHFYTKDQENKVAYGTEKLLEEINKSADYESYGVISPFRLASATEKFEDAPLRISLFSDFQCPVCKVFAEEILPKLLRIYAGKINFQYFFYPMDSSCNHNISQPLHPMACEASYLAACSGNKFEEIHDKIYQSQNNLSQELMLKLANTYDLSACYNSLKAKNIVEEMILDGDKLGIQATPTLIINGKKLEGLLPLKYFILFFDDALKKRSD